MSTAGSVWLLIEPVWNRNINSYTLHFFEPVWIPHVLLLIEPVWNRNVSRLVSSVDVISTDF